MALSRGRRYEPVNYWPGFVDALSTMLLVIIFLLSVFMLAQFFLSRAVSGKDEALARLNRQIEQLFDHDANSIGFRVCKRVVEIQGTCSACLSSASIKQAKPQKRKLDTDDEQGRQS